MKILYSPLFNFYNKTHMKITKGEHPSNKDISKAFDTLSRSINLSKLSSISINSTEEIFTRYKNFRGILLSIEEMLAKVLPKKIRLSEAVDRFVAEEDSLNTVAVTTPEYVSKEIIIEFTRLKNAVSEIVSKRTQDILNTIPDLPPTTSWTSAAGEMFSDTFAMNKRDDYKRFKNLKIFSRMEKDDILPHIEKIGLIREFSMYLSSSPANSRYCIAPWINKKHSSHRLFGITIDWDMIPEQSANILLDEKNAKTDFFIKDKEQFEENKKDELQKEKKHKEQKKESMNKLKENLLSQISTVEGIECLSLEDIKNNLVFEEILHVFNFDYASVATFADKTEVILLIKEVLEEYLSAR